jgi:hypothetical protein
MFAVLHALGMFVADLFKSRWQLEAENLFLRHQLSIALRSAPPRLRLCGADRALLIWMTRIWPGLLGMAQVVQPETILRWHRTGFKVFWCWKSRPPSIFALVLDEDPTILPALLCLSESRSAATNSTNAVHSAIHEIHRRRAEHLLRR